ncbi:hypothetical protein [Opitutus sp. ER46]|uniref:hypothetical protein n=1 Tax=Opitutus sp. ER46 TaxID=2161864 RepID=UPI0013047E32|nr:hypothetical protein [Opitutus sp. ER46]
MPALFSTPIVRPAHSPSICPFHDGLDTLDALLAELNPSEPARFDAVLDLRTLAQKGRDAAACVDQLFRVRALLGDVHYLAFYRVRCWAHRTLRVEVRPHRAAAWRSLPFPRNGARVDEVVNEALAAFADAAGGIPPFAQVRFTFAAASRRATGVSAACR